jgi:SAM-dependent methyltransferase
MSVSKSVPASEDGRALAEEGRASLKLLIEKLLAKAYISESSFLAYKTGNRYQSVQLGDEVLTGFRGRRTDLFDILNFSGRSVLDCGCNIGEMSRLARTRGARLVDGYEFDPYFVLIARAINALNGVTRVSFYEKDLTRATSYEDTFDVALAFSVYPYISQTLSALCQHVKEAVVLETHDIKRNMHAVYIEPFKKEFPFHTFVTVTDQGKGEGRRAVLVFAREETTLYKVGGVLTSTIDVENSKFDFLTTILGDHQAQQSSDAVAAINAHLAGSWGKEGAKWNGQYHVGGRAYWRAMMEGYLDYRCRGGVTDTNPYVSAFNALYSSGKLDPVLKQQLDMRGDSLPRIERRFKDIDAIAAGGDAVGQLAPLRFVDVGLSPGRKHEIRHGELDQTMYVDDLDGYHRLFWARFFGVRKLNAIFQVGASIAN